MLKTGFVQGLDGKGPSPLSGIGSPTDIPTPGQPQRPVRAVGAVGAVAGVAKPVARDPLTGKILRRSAPIMPISSEELEAVKQVMATGPRWASGDLLGVAGPFLHSFPFPGYNPARDQVELDDEVVHLVARPHYSW